MDFASVTQVTALANRILDSPVLAVPSAAESIAFTMCKMQDRACRPGDDRQGGWGGNSCPHAGLLLVTWPLAKPFEPCVASYVL